MGRTEYNIWTYYTAAYLASLKDPECTELALNEYKTATNMTDEFAALVAITQNPGKHQDQVLAHFYNKWKHDYLVMRISFIYWIVIMEIFSLYITKILIYWIV